VERSCRYCGKSLRGTHPNKKLCSQPCINKDRYAKYGQRCTSKQRSKWYKKRCKRKGHRDKLREQDRGRHKRVLDFVRKYKLERGCAKCGYSDHHAALEFDHIRGTKKLNVSLAKSISQAKNEIKKCQVLCSNCHKIVTFERAQ